MVTYIFSIVGLRGQNSYDDQYYILKGTTNGDNHNFTVAAYREMRFKSPNWYLKQLYGIDIPRDYSQIFHATDTGNTFDFHSFNVICKACYI